jgi:hypothetical protein
VVASGEQFGDRDVPQAGVLLAVRGMSERAAVIDRVGDTPRCGRQGDEDTHLRFVRFDGAGQTEAAGRLSLSLNGLATDLDTEHGGTDANKRDGAGQVGPLNVAGLQL